jgi:hypothetical protein
MNSEAKETQTRFLELHAIDTALFIWFYFHGLWSREEKLCALCKYSQDTRSSPPDKHRLYTRADFTLQTNTELLCIMAGDGLPLLNFAPGRAGCDAVYLF